MEVRVDDNNSWYLLLRLQDVNPDGEVITTLNICSFKTKAEAQSFVDAFARSTKKMQGFMASYMIVNRKDFERIK